MNYGNKLLLSLNFFLISVSFVYAQAKPIKPASQPSQDSTLLTPQKTQPKVPCCYPSVISNGYKYLSGSANWAGVTVVDCAPEYPGSRVRGLVQFGDLGSGDTHAKKIYAVYCEQLVLKCGYASPSATSFNSTTCTPPSPGSSPSRAPISPAGPSTNSPSTPDSTFLSPQQNTTRVPCCYTVTQGEGSVILNDTTTDWSTTTTIDCSTKFPNSRVRAFTQYGDNPVVTDMAKKVSQLFCEQQITVCGYANSYQQTYDSTTCFGKPSAL